MPLAESSTACNQGRTRSACNEGRNQRHSVARRGTQRHSEAINRSGCAVSSTRGHSGAIRGNRRPSKAIEGNQEERMRRLEHLFRRVKRLRARKIGARCAEARRVARVVPVYNQRSSEVIGGHQWQSEVISVVQGPSVVISGHQWSSVAIRSHQRRTGAISGHQWSSVAIRGHPAAYRGRDLSTSNKSNE